MMSTKRKYKSAAFEAIYSAAEGLFKVGGISKETMLDFRKSCLTGPRSLKSTEKMDSKVSIEGFVPEEPSTSQG